MEPFNYYFSELLTKIDQQDQAELARDRQDSIWLGYKRADNKREYLNEWFTGNALDVMLDVFDEGTLSVNELSRWNSKDLYALLKPKIKPLKQPNTWERPVYRSHN